MKTPVSVVIPTYNRPDMLAEAIQSVLVQTRPASEIIIVDNGFYRETKSVVGRFAGKVRYETSATRGPSPSRNRGVEAATSPYVAFLDDDDLWHPEKLALQMEFVDEHPDVGMVSTQVIPHGKPIKIKKKRWLYGDLFPRLFMESFVRTSSVIVNKVVFEQVKGFNLKYMRAEDYDLWLRIAEKTLIAHFQGPLAWNRKGPERLSDDKIDLRKSALDVLYTRYDARRISKRDFKRRISDVLLYLGREQVKAGRKGEGRSGFLEAVKLTPLRLRPLRYLIRSAWS